MCTSATSGGCLAHCCQHKQRNVRGRISRGGDQGRSARRTRAGLRRGDSLIPILPPARSLAARRSRRSQNNLSLDRLFHLRPHLSKTTRIMLRPSLLRRAGALLRPVARAGPSVVRPAAMPRMPLRPFSFSARMLRHRLMSATDKRSRATRRHQAA